MFHNFSNGYIYEYTKPCFNSWLLIPAETFWPKWLRGILYTLAILYIFLGIAIAADIFMLSIEMITSKKRIIYTYDIKKKKRVQREIFIWNETVANLTLMALGSSAPEILIAVFETLSSLDSVETKDALGIFTIIGSASYNLLVISAVCIFTVPSNKIKRISEFGVFIITSIWSMFAYFWLLIVLKWSSPNEIEIWEAVLTFCFFPLLVLTAFGQDQGWWIYKCIKRQKMIEQASYKENASSSSYEMQHPSTNNSHLVNTQSVNPSLHSKPEVKIVSKKTHNVSNKKEGSLSQQIDSTMSRSFARARFRHAVVVNMTGRVRENKSDVYNASVPSKDLTKQRNMIPSLELTDIRDIKSGTFCFSSSNYSVCRTAGRVEIDILFNKKCRTSTSIGFSHVVEVARKRSLIINGINRMQCVHHKPHTAITSLPTVGESPNIISKSVCNSLGRNASTESIIDKDNECVKSPLKKLHQKITSTNSPSRKVKVVTVDETLKNKNADVCLNNSEALLSKLNNLQNVFWIHYETREGNAKCETDFLRTEGLLLFLENEYTKKISIPLCVTSSYSEAKDFYVLLKDPCPDTCIGGPSIAHVYLVNEDEPGEFVFQNPTYHIQCSTPNSASATAQVIRIHGNDGQATLFYRTVDGTALGGNMDFQKWECDYEHVEEGILNFQSGQTSNNIIINVNPAAKKDKTFIIVLYHVTGCGKIGQRCAAIISLSTEADEIVDQITSMTNDPDDEQPQNASLKTQWKKQFQEAVSLSGEPSYSAMCLHFLCFLWKMLLAFIPPRTVLGGWAAFIVSLLTLGVMSALVEQFAKLLGCVIGLHVSITGITLVALGTSMPDTFASKTAAEQDDTADAAIGNITGSNSVNVFLGLGLPWVIKSVHLWKKGSKLTMENDNLTFSLVVFLACGSISLVTLVVRRALYKGELGGPSIPKYISSSILILLWLTFVTLSSLQAYGVIQLSIF